MQALQGNAEMDRILTLLAVQERMGLAEEGPLPPRALADAAIQARPKLQRVVGSSGSAEDSLGRPAYFQVSSTCWE